MAQASQTYNSLTGPTILPRWLLVRVVSEVEHGKTAFGQTCRVGWQQTELQPVLRVRVETNGTVLFLLGRFRILLFYNDLRRFP